MENNNCIFCSKEKLNIIYEDDIFYVIRDAYPVTTDHTLIILNEHNKTYFDLRDKDIIQLNNIIKFQKDSLIGKTYYWNNWRWTTRKYAFYGC